MHNVQVLLQFSGVSIHIVLWMDLGVLAARGHSAAPHRSREFVELVAAFPTGDDSVWLIELR